MVILGLNAYHADAAACIVRDGVLVAAAEEERFRRIKHWAGLPTEATRWCLADAGITLADVDHVAVNQDSGANLWHKISYLAARRPDLGLVLDRIRNKRERTGVLGSLSEELRSPCRAQVHAVEHHLAHLASAYLVSPFDEAVTVSVDGFGDFASAAWGQGRDGRVQAEERIHFPHSLGVFYQALTQFIGFPNYGDEYKVMGLAPYGEPSLLAQMRRIVRLKDDGGFELDLAYFRHHKERIAYEWAGGEPTFGPLWAPALEELLGPARKKGEELTRRHHDIARSVQAMYEEALFHLLNHLHARYGGDALCLAGGCAMNSVANGRVYANTPFRRLYVHPAAGDAGGAIGAALVAWGEVAGDAKRRLPLDHAYWGPQFDDAAIGKVLDARGAEIEAAGCRVERVADEATLVDQAATAVSEGLVLGWFQGRMEWGPRALGNRSIVCDPRRADRKEILNLKIKRRESFRPFAPSVLREAVADWFEVDDDVPFMMQVYPIRAGKRALIPAVTHVDGSGRLQTVTREQNPRYRALIERFRELTGVPMVLNTSFNENEPIVCRPEEALDCFLRTKMDLLAMGNWLLRRGDVNTG